MPVTNMQLRHALATLAEQCETNDHFARGAGPELEALEHAHALVTAFDNEAPGDAEPEWVNKLREHIAKNKDITDSLHDMLLNALDDKLGRDFSEGLSDAAVQTYIGTLSPHTLADLSTWGADTEIRDRLYSEIISEGVPDALMAMREIAS